MNKRILRRRVPFVPQMEVADCGAACLAMICGYHGRDLGLAESRRLCGTSSGGTTAYLIARAAEASGLEVQAVRLVDPTGIQELALPAMAHCHRSHFVVIERLTDKFAYVVDPAVGRRKVPIPELARELTGTLLTFSTGPRFARRRRERTSVASYLGSLNEYSPSLALFLAAALLVELVGLAVPVAGQVVVDVVVRPQRSDLLVVLGVILAVTMLARLALTALRDIARHTLDQRLEHALLTRCVDHLVRLPLEFFQRRTTGDLVERVSSNYQLGGISLRLLTIFIDVVVLASFGVVIVGYDAMLGGVVLGGSIARVPAVSWLRNRGRGPAERERVCRARETAVVLDAFSVPELTKGLGMEDDMVQRYTSQLRERLSASVDRRRITEAAAKISVAADGALYALVIWLGGSRVLSGEISVGVLAAFLSLAVMLQRPLESLLGGVAQVSRLDAVRSRIDDIVASPVERAGDQQVDLHGGLLAQDVTFRYGADRPAVVRRINLHVRPGERVAVVGPSGAGKSTLLRILVGLLAPGEGTVRLDDVDLAELDRARLRRQIGVVLQDDLLLDDTVRANLALKDPSAPLSELAESARAACIDDVIDALPLGYNTPLGFRGGALSGGERQRIAIARALVGSPRLLVFDEATSCLDVDTEARIIENLANLGATLVVVTHRLANVRHFDRFVVMDEGRIVQEGSYDQLLLQPGIFRQMAVSC